MNNDLISYATDFTSFLIKNTQELNNIKNIILFGSVARNEASKESDVDIFIELQEPNKNFQNNIDKIKKKFYETIKFKQYWLLLGIENELNTISGTFNEWKELKNSIISNGITLYGKFNATPEGENSIITYWEEIKPNTKRVTFNKKIFGYKQNKKQYPGLIQKHNGQKIGKGAIILPLEAKNDLREITKKLDVKTKNIIIHQYN